MATSGSGQLNAWNGTYTITLTFTWSRDGNGVVSWNVDIPTIDGTNSPCWKDFYIRGGNGPSASGNLTGNLVSNCPSCSQCASHGYNGNILWPQNQPGTINMGTSGGTLRLGFFGTRNAGNTEENYLTWGVDPTTWTARLYYDANGGTNAPEREKHEGISPSTNSYDFTVTSAQPTRSGYMFLGWATSASATTPTIFAGDTYTVYQNNPGPTIYAVWTKYYRPGERKVSGTWSSTNRSGGACERKVSGTWTEMTTCDGGTGTGDPPSRKTSGTWYNQRKIGAE